MNTPRCLLLAFGFWVAGVLLIRFTPWVWSEVDLWSVVAFAVALPMAWLTIWLAARLGAFVPEQQARAVTFMCWAALLMDGAALMWAPGLYGQPPEALHRAAAFLLWTFGLTLAVGGRVPRQ
jgi:hypothetical protein